MLLQSPDSRTSDGASLKNENFCCTGAVIIHRTGKYVQHRVLDVLQSPVSKSLTADWRIPVSPLQPYQAFLETPRCWPVTSLGIVGCSVQLEEQNVTALDNLAASAMSGGCGLFKIQHLDYPVRLLRLIVLVLLAVDIVQGRFRRHNAFVVAGSLPLLTMLMIA